MASYVIICHGGRGTGTSAGTYVIPKGVKIHFFTEDGVNMNSAGGKLLISALLDKHPAELDVQKAAVETKGQYETIPNYNAAPGGAEFPVPTGVYRVGQGPKAGGPVVPITKRTRLSDIIGGGSGGGVLGNDIYWLACRAVKLGANSYGKEVVSTFNGKAMGRIKVANAMGLSPSQVKATGKWQ